MENRDLKELLRKAYAEIEVLTLENNQLAFELKSAQDLVEEIQNTLSWRITKPLRSMRIGLGVFWKAVRLVHRAPAFLTNVKHFGLKESLKRVRFRLQLAKQSNLNHLIETDEQILAQQRATAFNNMPTLSIVVPVYNTKPEHLIELLDSIQAQSYSKWELILADASDTNAEEIEALCKKHLESDKRAVYLRLTENVDISTNTNAGIAMTTGEYIGLVDHDDILHPSAFFELIKAINETDADLLYTDELNFEDELSSGVYPHFKPDFSPDTLRSYNYICHLMVFSRELYEECGGLRPECSGSQDYDMALRFSEAATQITHIPKVLYYWRRHKASFSDDIKGKALCISSAFRALNDHLERVGFDGTVENAKIFTNYRIAYEIKGTPKVSIIIPNKDHTNDLDNCLQSILQKSSYTNFELVIVENNSTDAATFEYYEQLKDPRITLIKYEGNFNFSAINNFAARKASGKHLLFLNNDTEVITPAWIEEMLMFSQRKDIAAVGAKLYYPDDTIQHAGVILGIGGIAGHSHKGFKRDEAGYSNRLLIVQNLSAVTGACLMISEEKFWEVGGFTEEFAVALNDVDLCLKLREKGYYNVFTPYAELYHYESKSRGYEDSPEKRERFRGESLAFRSRWGEILNSGDPCYNPNLTLFREDFSIDI